MFKCLLLMMCIGGCNKSAPDVGPVSGRITLDGRPLEFANITFQQEGKSPGIGESGPDGHYELMYKRGIVGAPIGKNKVSIRLDSELAHRPDNIPVRYNSKSDLERDVKPGQNVFDFDLTTEEKK